MSVGLDPAWVREVVLRALAEDLGPGWVDVTTSAVVPVDDDRRAEVVAAQNGVVCGLVLLPVVLAEAAARLDLPVPTADLRVNDGAGVEVGDVLADLRGPTRVLLVAERTMLNLVRHLSGVATQAARWVEALEDSGAGPARHPVHHAGTAPARAVRGALRRRHQRSGRSVRRGPRDRRSRHRGRARSPRPSTPCVVGCPERSCRWTYGGRCRGSRRSMPVRGSSSARRWTSTPSRSPSGRCGRRPRSRWRWPPPGTSGWRWRSRWPSTGVDHLYVDILVQGAVGLDVRLSIACR